MAVVPLCAAFYLLDRAVATSLDLGFNGSSMPWMTAPAI
jgi:hypothetical protein